MCVGFDWVAQLEVYTRFTPGENSVLYTHVVTDCIRDIL